MQRQEALFARQRRNNLVRVVLFGTPLLLCLVELGHPVLDTANTFHMLSPIVIWWIILHIMLAPLFGLIGWAFFILLEGVSGPLALISRIAACAFSVFVIGYEFAIGLVSGIVTLNALGLPPEQMQVIQRSLTRLLLSPIFDRMALAIILTSALAIITAALALARAGAPRWPLFLFLGSLLFARAHESPFGPIGNLSFFVAALCLEVVWNTAAQQKSSSASVSSTPAAKEPYAIS